MCGIFTVIPKKKYKINLDKCKKALGKLKRRGPDWTFYKIINNNFFGQTVLSMTGKQKKDVSIHYSKNKKYFVVFNGEIYNYKNLKEHFKQHYFTKGSPDTNILINLFEVKKIEKINTLLDGMYAYVVCDISNKLIYISRDPQGEKTLFKYEDEKMIIISSEIDPILDYSGNNSISKDILKTYFYSRHFIQFDKTIYKNITMIEPGELIRINCNNNKTTKLNSTNIHNYIDEKKYSQNLKKSEDELVEELDYLFQKNISEMVPNNRNFTSIISGGVDSSLISAFLNKISNPKKFLTLNHINKDYISNKVYKFEKYLNKNIYAQNISESDYKNRLTKAIKICASPISSHDFVGKLILAEITKKNNCKAIFGGDGADELFGGYQTYNQKINNVKINISNYSKLINENLFKSNKEFYYYKKKLDYNWKKSLSSYNFVSNKSEKNKLSMMLMDSSIQLSSVGLRGSDLMSMHCSIEPRSIFLRRDIVSFALNLPLKFKISISKSNKVVTKILLKKLFCKYFDKNLLFKKQGFSGFPNETGKHLGAYKDFNINKLNFFDKKIKNNKFDQSTKWKIFNTEFFLRNYKGDIIE